MNDKSFFVPEFMHRTFFLSDEDTRATLAEKCHALSSVERLAILNLLSAEDKTVSEIAKLRHLSVSTALFHLKILKKAGLIDIILMPGRHGMVQLCHVVQTVLHIVNYPKQEVSDVECRTVDIPVGMYTACEMEFVAGFCTSTEQIMFDDGNFFDNRRAEAMLIWGSGGYVEYTVNNLHLDIPPKKFDITFEICSEIIGYRNGWKSDITVWLCDQELGTFTSPSDFGGRRGRLNPIWWPDTSTQYGELIQVLVTKEGVYLGNEFLPNSPTIQDFAAKRIFTLRIGNKSDAKNKGGFNLFGEAFGDYPQNIRFSILY